MYQACEKKSVLYQKEYQWHWFRNFSVLLYFTNCLILTSIPDSFSHFFFKFQTAHGKCFQNASTEQVKQIKRSIDTVCKHLHFQLHNWVQTINTGWLKKLYQSNISKLTLTSPPEFISFSVSVHFACRNSGLVNCCKDFFFNWEQFSYTKSVYSVANSSALEMYYVNIYEEQKWCSCTFSVYLYLLRIMYQYQFLVPATCYTLVCWWLILIYSQTYYVPNIKTENKDNHALLRWFILL